ncbi:hypothetical protein AGABI1DRAFT_114405 [Agaricus bisporus var. burnettii JB137-S8]|uniref:Uncharacterized protein n=1 Tax=Agaricus bisporus var. burnettii (strain JB137-S8 / ATCC MYA-4627 / FGSC 10392) TaxID=597362 RepID=K5X780_AGABU|nr:uncharacterized protein AGABI1DRAFT_114405 [Agaricus bisporus var. burnettii JB137-S8]EKM78827.1 hypothetical protein AGABI1DRAFT_114405 [Agaricus bisporus var. burnettii JB137-S8]
MSRPSKPLTVARLNDAILGCFGCFQPSATLDHLVHFLGTWGGSDKLFMVIQYTIKLIVPFLRLRARLQHRAGLRHEPISRAANACAKFDNMLGDSRTLWRFVGLLPILQWLISLERNQQPTRNIHVIERLQGWAMLAYYPLEHLYYLSSHGIIPNTVKNPLRSISQRKFIRLDPNTLGIWSCRCWALYVILQFFHLRENRRLLRSRQKALRKAKSTGLTPAEKEELTQRWDAWWSEVVVNLGYLPLTIHWSLKKGLYKNELWTAIFGLIAGVASFRSGWRATALPSSPRSGKKDEGDSPPATGYDVPS